MPAILIEPPAAEPLLLAEAKSYLRVAHDADDALIQSLIAGARGQVEARTRRALLPQSWRIVLDAWPSSGRIASPVSPLQAVAAARVFDAAGEAEALDSEIFLAMPDGIVFDSGRVTHPGRMAGGIEIDIEAGYGTAADVPAPLIQAMRLLLARAYEYRDRIEADAMPNAIAELIAPFRVVSL